MIQSKRDYWYYLERDRVATAVSRCRSIRQKIKSWLFPHYEWRFIKALRYLEYCENVRKNQMGGVFAIVWAKYKFRKISVKLGYSIPINVFGPGLSLPHRGNIIVNPHTVIGENCRIHVGVNIGAHHNLAPRIGNNVYLGPGAIIFGNVQIADNVSVGANATVNKSILTPNVVVAGTPAVIVKTKTPSWNGIVDGTELSANK